MATSPTRQPGQAAQGRRVLREAGDQGCPVPSPYRRERPGRPQGCPGPSPRAGTQDSPLLQERRQVVLDRDRRVASAQDDGCPPGIQRPGGRDHAVTFQYSEVFVCEEVWGHVSYGRDREAIILTPQDDVSAAMLASVGQLDPTDLSRVEEV